MSLNLQVDKRVLELLAGGQGRLDLLLDLLGVLGVAEPVHALLEVLAAGLRSALELELLVLGVAVLLVATLLEREVLEALEQRLLLGRRALDLLVEDHCAVVPPAAARGDEETEAEGQQARADKHAMHRVHERCFRVS
jgi:hypothetical protein